MIECCCGCQQVCEKLASLQTTAEVGSNVSELVLYWVLCMSFSRNKNGLDYWLYPIEIGQFLFQS